MTVIAHKQQNQKKMPVIVPLDLAAEHQTADRHSQL